MTYIEKFWRDATAADVARVMAGEMVEARFRDLDREDWIKPTTLKGWTADGKKWLGFCAWNFCQVYATPQWFLDKPEPGEGYRLLGKFPDEPVQGGDFAFDRLTRWSSLRDGCMPTQAEGIWYRRRIEQPKPEPKHYVLQVGDTVETPSGHLIKIVDRPTEQMHYTLRVGDTADVPSGHRIAITEHGVEVT